MLRRHRGIVVAGCLITVLLSILSYVQVSPSGISYRSPQTWSNQATLVLTQEGAPELRSVLPSGPGGSSSPLADTGRFASLIDVYSSLATSDAVVQELRRRGLIKAEDVDDGALPIAAAALPSTVNAATPMMTITGTALDPAKATQLTVGATNAFLDVLNTRQRKAKIPVKDRIQVRVVRKVDVPKLVDPRSKALPILVLLGGLIATVAVAFTRENVARRRKAVLELTPLLPPVDEEVSTVHGHRDTRSKTRPLTTAESEPGEAPAAIGVARGRSTLGSVPGTDSKTSGGQEKAEDLAGQSRHG